MKTKQIELLNRAKQYPYELPGSSYLFLDGDRLDIKEINFESFSDSIVSVNGSEKKLREVLAARGISETVDLLGLVPVLAVGSNASFDQLARKFGTPSRWLKQWSGIPTHIVLPVIRAELSDFDVVYSAHFTRYGAIPATLIDSADTVAHLFVTFLDKPLLDRMHQTEAVGTNYSYQQLSNIRLLLEGRHCLSSAFTYSTVHGFLSLEGSPVALSAIRADRRRYPAKDEITVLREVMWLLGAGDSLDEFALQNIESPPLRRKRSALLPRIQIRDRFRQAV